MLKEKWLAIALCATVSGCASVTNPHPASPVQVSSESAAPSSKPSPPRTPPPELPSGVAAEPSPPTGTYELQDWRSLPDWDGDNLAEALPAFLRSCNVLKSAQEWIRACAIASEVRKDDPIAARKFFESSFAPWLVHNATGATEGLVTGYY